MDVIYQSDIPHETKEICNQVRIWLNVLTLADIIIVDSDRKLLPQIMEGQKGRNSTWKWPKVHPCPDSFLTIWSNTMKTIIQPYLETHPLGQWIRGTHQQWASFANEEGTFITIGNDHFSRPNPTAQFSSSTNSTNATRVADIIAQELSLLGVAQQTIPKLEDHPPSLPPKFKRWRTTNQGDHNISPESMQKAADLLREGMLVAASDGSIKSEKGGHAWILAHKETNDTIISGVAAVNGKGHELNSTRAEMLGILAIVNTIQDIHSHYDITGSKITIYTDSKLSMQNAKCNLNGTRQMFLTDIDVILQLQYEFKHLPFSVVLSHVKSHQDDSKPYDDLTNDAKLNCEMDKKVNEFMQGDHRHSSTYPIFPAQKYFISVRNKVVPNNIASSLLASYNDSAWRKHMQKRLGLKKDSIPKVNWLPVQKLISTKKHTSGYIKSIHQEWNTMARCKLWKTAATDKCPLCESAKESWEHVYQCNNEHAVRERKVYLNTIKESLDKLHTHPSLRELVLNILQQLSDKQTPTFTPPTNPDEVESLMPALFTSQTRIGWKCFLKGLISLKWGEAQEKYYIGQRMDHKFNKTRWCNKLVSLISDFQRTLWNNRCNIVNLENELTLEKRKRKQLQELHQYINRNAWKLRNNDRHLLRHPETFFQKASMQQIDVWEQQVFVALNRSHSDPNAGLQDIRNFGTIHTVDNPRITHLRPTQISTKYNQCSLHQFFPSPPIRPTYTTTEELQQIQHQIDNHLNNCVPPTNPLNVHNSPPSHRNMAQVTSLARLRSFTCKINNC